MSNFFYNFIFFGSSEFSVIVLEALKNAGILPNLIITVPDSPSGRGLKLNSSPTKLWAIENKINYIQPVRLDFDNSDVLENIRIYQAKFFLVASYGKIIPKKVLDIPKYGSYNIHPSLLPKYRGPSPIQSQILADEKEVGVTIIKMDDQVDHGEIVESIKYKVESYENGWPLSFKQLGKILFEKGIETFIASLPKIISGELKFKIQDHSQATFTRKFEKKDGEIDLDAGRKAWLAYLALSSTLGVFFFIKHKERKIKVKITDAEFKDEKFIPLKVIPEGKKEMRYGDFLRGN